jgi:DNA replication protein DnaC
MELKPQLVHQLRGLRMSGVLETLEARERQAIDGQWSYLEFLSRLLEDETERRAQKQLIQRVRRSALNTSKTLEGFDFQFNPALNRQQILQLASCEYVRQHRNLLICGPTGVGKTHVSQALGLEAAKQGFDVLFVSAQKMLQHIHGGRADGSLERRINSYLRPDLLILDDFGLKPIQPPGHEDLYDIINERYEKGSILLTSNRAPSEWAEVFRDPLLASAGLDRLLDRAEVIILRGASYRAQSRVRLNEEAPVTPN